MPHLILTVLGLLSVISASLGQHHALQPRHTQLKPLKPVAVIPGLLRRAAACDTCGIGGVCCSNGECCGTAQRCCSDGGCCEITQFCDTVAGVKGCCPVGAVCDGPPKTSTSKTSTGTSAASSPTASHTALTSVPTPPSGSQNVEIDMSDSTLEFSGQWASIKSSCNSSATSKSVSSDGITEAEFSTISYSFTGSAVYLKTSSIKAHWTIILDGDETEYGTDTGFGELAATPNCTYGWWRDNLASTYRHTIDISAYGATSSGAMSGRAGQAWALEVHNFVVTKPSNSSSSSSSGNSSTSGGDSDSGSGTATSPSGALSVAAGRSLALCLMFAVWTVLFQL
ncbi:hypothetical protein C8R46DRAFT_206764 [Mycena filopes]|nr:hypothetical protein C8R46DRAFT_206764 [Mycena filopes]